MLSSGCKYGIRAVTYLAINGKENDRIGIKIISKALNVPSPYLGKILQILTRHKLLHSTKGPNGGFALARKPKEISLLDIIEIIDGPYIFDDCLIGLSTCSASAHNDVQCPIHKKYLPISKQIYDLFKSETIEKLKKDIIASNGKIGL